MSDLAPTWLGNPSIVGLLFGRGPFDVSGLVRSVIVNPVYGVLHRGSGANVIVKCLKVIFPFWADDNSTTAVTSVMRIVQVKASGFHAFPNPILTRLGHAVFGENPFDRFFDPATAGGRVTGQKVVLGDNGVHSAFAGTVPEVVKLPIASLRYGSVKTVKAGNRKFPENQTREFFHVTNSVQHCRKGYSHV